MIEPKIIEGTVTWNAQSGIVKAPCEDAKLAIYNPDNHLVYVILRRGDSDDGQLNTYRSNGSLFASLAPPEGFSFYYMLPYEGLGVSIICSTADPKEARPDWHFRFDDKTNALIRHCPAY